MLFPAEGAPPELQAVIAASREEALEQIRRLLAWGIAEGASAGGLSSVPPVDVELFARMLVGLAEGAARMVLDEPQVWTVERFTTFARQILDALAAAR